MKMLEPSIDQSSPAATQWQLDLLARKTRAWGGFQWRYDIAPGAGSDPLAADQEFRKLNREFLAAHPDATVLNLGCGLDSRVFRIDPPAAVRWYDVDLPDVIALRKQLYPERRDSQMIGSSVTEMHWLDGIAGDRPVIVVAEGLVQYLSREEAIALFNRITEQFSSGQIIFDAYNHFTSGMINLMVKVTSLRSKPTAAGTTVHLTWGYDDLNFAKEIPRLKLVTATPFLTIPELMERLSTSKAQAAIGRMMSSFGWYQRSMQHFRYEF
jgi:O-methyltransferase involved in polyketide biosynthesis